MFVVFLSMKLRLVQYLTVVAVMSLVDMSAGGSCKAAKLCCQGRDSGCVIQKASPNAIIESPRDKPCYCDHACLKLNDCCDDFRETCSVVDCIVSEWGMWSTCDNHCGVGIQSRIRVVTQPRQNGGKHCPQLEQSRICQEYSGCHHLEDNDLPIEHVAQLTTWSETNFKLNETTIAPEGECRIFTIIWTSRSCRKDFPSLTLGAQICGMCRNDGQSVSCPSDQYPMGPTKIGRWKTATRCHGKWIGSSSMNSSSQQCDPSNCKNKMSLIYA